MDIIVTRATPNDIKTLQLTGRETFLETFAEGNSEADMQKYLDESFSEERINRELHNPGSQFFIARENGNAVGYLKLNTGEAQTELQDTNALEIERIYVKAAYHGKKVGQLLYDIALEVARAERKSYIWLGVWEHNLRAVNFYKKNGFVEFGQHIFRLGDDEQTDIMMKKVMK
jgi:diamine N-acetyltransferase